MLKTSRLGRLIIVCIVNTGIYIHILTHIHKPTIVNMSIKPHIGQTIAIGKNTLTCPRYIFDIVRVEFVVEKPVATLMPANTLALTLSIENHSTNTTTFSDNILHTSGANIRVHFLGLLGIATVTEKRTRVRASISNRTRHDETTLTQLIITVCNFHGISPCVLLFYTVYRHSQDKKF